ncbi:MAG TPA: hypothetical protein VM285_02735 [Polyangia bacterium]|nr:hypothetical protein [Polyangia bacterium]
MRLFLLAALCIAVAAAAAPARAGEPVSEPFDPGAALGQSLGFTLGGLAVGGLVALREPLVGASIGVLGLAVGPASGHFYAERWPRALGMTGARLGLGVASLVLLVSAARDGCDACWMPGAGTGAAALGLAILDIADAPAAARRAGAEAARPPVALAPWIAPAGQGGGLALAAGF